MNKKNKKKIKEEEEEEEEKKERYGISVRSMWQQPSTIHNLLSQQVVK